MSTNNFLPFTKPTIDEETIQAVVDVLRSGWMATGPKVTQFEQDLAQYLGFAQNKDAYIRVMTSATGGLEMALAVCDVNEGDEVIVPAMSFVASANVVCLRRAKPVFVDVGLKSHNILVDQIEAAITKKTKAIMPVHLGGLAADLDPIYDLAKKYNLRVVEDAAQAIGTRYKGKLIGSFGDIVSFSFHPNKNITSIEGGGLVLHSEKEAKFIDLYRFHGLTRDAFGNMDVTFPSGKFNMPDVSAVVGVMQLKHVEKFNQKRKSLVARYFDLMKDDDIITLPERGDDGHSWHVFYPLINFDRLTITRPQFIKLMGEKGIGVGVHYPAMHLFSYYRSLGYKEGDFPNTEKIGRETVTLPLFPLMEISDVDRVVETLYQVVNSNKR